MLTKPKTSGTGKVVKFKRRQQKRNPRRPLEAVAQDFERWDAAAAAAGLNWSEFTRRALNEASRDVRTFGLHSATLSEKGGAKNDGPKRTKVTGTRAARKG